MNSMVAEAYTWLGTPHVNQAKVKGKGVDCGMLLIACLENTGRIKKRSDTDCTLFQRMAFAPQYRVVLKGSRKILQ